NSKSLGIDFSIPTSNGPQSLPELIGPFHLFDARVNASQTLLDWSATVRVRAARAQADGSRAERGVTVEGTALTAALAYLRAVRGDWAGRGRVGRGGRPRQPSRFEGGAGACRGGAADRVGDPRGTAAAARGGSGLRRQRADGAGRHLHARRDAAGERADSRRL